MQLCPTVYVLKIKIILNQDEIIHQIPALGGNPKVSLIIANWRTGSTFLSELVSSNLKDMRFFIYEPLMSKFRVSRLRESEDVKKVNDAIHFKQINCYKLERKKNQTRIFGLP